MWGNSDRTQCSGSDLKRDVGMRKDTAMARMLACNPQTQRSKLASGRTPGSDHVRTRLRIEC